MKKIPIEFKDDIKEWEAIKHALLYITSIPNSVVRKKTGAWFIAQGFKNIHIKRRSWQKLYKRFNWNPEKAFDYLIKFIK